MTQHSTTFEIERPVPADAAGSCRRVLPATRRTRRESSIFASC